MIYDKQINDLVNKIKLNEIVYNTYIICNNNYYYSININNIINNFKNKKEANINIIYIYNINNNIVFENNIQKNEIININIRQQEFMEKSNKKMKLLSRKKIKKIIIYLIKCLKKSII